MEDITVYYKDFDSKEMLELVKGKCSIELELLTGERGAIILNKENLLHLPETYTTIVVPSFDDRQYNKLLYKNGGLVSSYCFVFTLCGIAKVKYYPIEYKPWYDLTNDDKEYLKQWYPSYIDSMPKTNK